MASKPAKTLVDEKLAVSLFLDSLLREPQVDIEPVVEAPPIEAPPIEASPIEVPIQTQPVEDIPASAPTVVEAEVEPVTATEAVTEAEAQLPNEAPKTTPDWANEPFQAMLFKVAGLTLAVPLVELSGVVEWTEDITEMPGHADFYMGLLQHLDKSIPVIDTARLVLPADKLTALAGDDPRERVTRIVLINDNQWGLACDSVAEVITLQPGEVRWRSDQTSRRWLAGTVIDHMCALLNGQAFAEMLAKDQ